jgi:tetratricopeptide (TPR) repeat protein
MRMFDGEHGHGAGMKHTSGDKNVNELVARSLRSELSAMGMKIPAAADYNRQFDSLSKPQTSVDRIVVGRVNYFGAVGPTPDNKPAVAFATFGLVGYAAVAAAREAQEDNGVSFNDAMATKTYLDLDIRVLEPQTGAVLWAGSVHKKSNMGFLSGPIANRVAENLADSLQEALKTATWRADFLTAMGTSALPNDTQAKAASAHEAKAKALFEAEQFAEAGKEFRKAYDAGSDAALLYNVGLCFRRAGDAERALAAYQEYLRRVPASPHRPNVEARIDELKQELRSNRKT